MATKDYSGETQKRIFHKLLDVIPDLLTMEEHGKSKVDGFMDFSVDILHRTPERIIIALSHYYIHPSGDMIADPDMEVAVYPRCEYAEALTYQDSFGYQSVKLDAGQVNARLQHDLNKFLSQWLTNLIMQGHCIKNESHADM